MSEWVRGLGPFIILRAAVVGQDHTHYSHGYLEVWTLIYKRVPLALTLRMGISYHLHT